MWWCAVLNAAGALTTITRRGKRGVGVERQRFQSTENLSRIVAITAFLVVPLCNCKKAKVSRPPSVTACSVKTNGKSCGCRLNTVSRSHRRHLPAGLIPRWPSRADFPIPSAQVVQGGTPFGTAGFACKNASRATSSMQLALTKCDQEIGQSRGLPG